jgi:type VI protein secretion system component VasF
LTCLFVCVCLSFERLYQALASAPPEMEPVIQAIIDNLMQTAPEGQSSFINHVDYFNTNKIIQNKISTDYFSMRFLTFVDRLLASEYEGENVSLFLLLYLSLTTVMR